jgi:hypothetical protein
VNIKWNIETVALDLMTPATQTYRKFDESSARTIAREFDAAKLGLVTLVRDGFRFIILDGQHRIAAARQVLGNDASIEARVTDDSEVARLFA